MHRIVGDIRLPKFRFAPSCPRKRKSLCLSISYHIIQPTFPYDSGEPVPSSPAQSAIDASDPFHFPHLREPSVHAAFHRAHPFQGTRHPSPRTCSTSAVNSAAASIGSPSPAAPPSLPIRSTHTKRDPSSPSPPLLPQRCAAPPRYKRDPSSPPPSPSVPPLPTRCPRLESRLAQQQPSPILLYMVLSRSVFLFVDVGPPVLASSPLSLRFRTKQAFASLSVCCVLDREGSSSCVIWWQPV